MLIPSKYSGYQAGIRLYPGGGGGGGGGGDGGDAGGGVGDAGGGGSGGDFFAPVARPITNQSTIVHSNINPSGQLSGDTFRPQYTQPVYQPQYNNYANPLTMFNVSQYGANSAPSTAFRGAMAPGGMGQDAFFQGVRDFASPFRGGYGADLSQFLPAMRDRGYGASDLQSAFSYSPSYFEGPSYMQMQSPFAYNANMQFNPYTASFQAPSPIVSRSAQVRGRPNVMMRRAEGGITSLLKED